MREYSDFEKKERKIEFYLTKFATYDIILKY